jgi:hypothetical protein
VGAIVDLPWISAMVMGLDDWDVLRCRTIHEERLLAAVRRQLGEQVERLVAPPRADGERNRQAALDEPLVGVPVTPFPQHMRCPLCERLAPRMRDIFDLQANPYRPERTKYLHSNCQRSVSGKRPPVVPARFLVACERGHLDDFPWQTFAKHKQQDCTGALVLHEFGASGAAASIFLRCTACDGRTSMAPAFEEDGLANVRCRGRRPHLRDFEEDPCNEPVKAILLGATNSWFPVSLTTLYVPPATKDVLAELVEERWIQLSAIHAQKDLELMRRLNLLGELAAHDDKRIWKAIEDRRAGDVAAAEEEDLLRPEWRVLSQPETAPRTVDFQLNVVRSPPRFEAAIERVILVERLREVTALTGFTRVGSPWDFDDALARQSAHRVPLSRRPPTFVPASEVRGEGIFIQFAENPLADWCADWVDREEQFLDAHRRWRRARNLEPTDAGFPGIRYVLLHTFSHTLMRQLALECGYSAASLRERIYCAEPGTNGEPMAGILIYTAAPDSEGTLGGLVSLGRPEQLERHVDEALEEMRLCSSDPLCSEHVPGAEGDGTLHGAACHACLFAPETSCERGNRFLDRLALVETVAMHRTPFFANAEHAG